MSVKTAFRDLAKMFHPDKGGDNRSMAALNELYEAASRGDGGKVRQVSESYSDKQIANAKHLALVKTASEIDINLKQIERMHEDDYNDYISNLNQQAQAIYYSRLADALEDQRIESMEAQAQAQNQIYRSQSNNATAEKLARSRAVRNGGGNGISRDESGQYVDASGYFVDKSGALYSGSYDGAMDCSFL